MAVSIVIVILVGYLLGNLNGAVCMSAILGDDVRKRGSGNAGLTNFVRNYGIGKAALVVLIDVGKAILACLVGKWLLSGYGMALEGSTLGGLSVMVGHDFPAFLGFRGGKGILSGWFVAWMVDWRIGLLIGIVFFFAYLITQYVSLGSVLAAVTFGILYVVFHYDNLLVCLCGIVMSVLTVFMHRGNILRLVKGQERKTNLFKKGTEK